ncbi:MAG: Fic family protein, partial [Patescibacteria group bacterium]
MYTPTYELTPQLLSLITTIERLYGQIEALRIPTKLELNLTRANLVKSTFASNRIEGNPLSEAEVTNLLLGDRVPVNRDEKEVVNYFAILKHLSDYQDKLITLDTIVDLHKQLLSGVDTIAGHIRDVAVVIGHYKKEKGDVSLRVKHNPPFHKKTDIEKALKELLEWMQTSKELPAALQAGLFHHQFVYLHPFEDGNGRVCRILIALLFLNRGYAINRYFVLDDYYDIDRDHYSDMLHSADTGNLTRWLTYFSEGMKYSLQSALSKYTDAMRTLRFEEQPTPKERGALRIVEEYKEVTAPKVAEILKVSRQQAHALLRSLVDKGLV